MHTHELIEQVVTYLAHAPREAWTPYRLTRTTTRYENEVSIPDHIAMLFATLPVMGGWLDRAPRLHLAVDRIIGREKLFAGAHPGGRQVLQVTPVFDTQSPTLSAIYLTIKGDPTESVLRGTREDLERMLAQLRHGA